MEATEIDISIVDRLIAAANTGSAAALEVLEEWAKQFLPPKPAGMPQPPEVNHEAVFEGFYNHIHKQQMEGLAHIYGRNELHAAYMKGVEQERKRWE